MVIALVMIEEVGYPHPQRDEVEIIENRFGKASLLHKNKKETNLRAQCRTAGVSPEIHVHSTPNIGHRLIFGSCKPIPII